jgi:hypothetical protein
MKGGVLWQASWRLLGRRSGDLYQHWGIVGLATHGFRQKALLLHAELSSAAAVVATGLDVVQQISTVCVAAAQDPGPCFQACLARLKADDAEAWHYTLT